MAFLVGLIKAYFVAFLIVENKRLCFKIKQPLQGTQSFTSGTSLKNEYNVVLRPVPKTAATAPDYFFPLIHIVYFQNRSRQPLDLRSFQSEVLVLESEQRSRAEKCTKSPCFVRSFKRFPSSFTLTYKKSTQGCGIDPVTLYFLRKVRKDRIHLRAPFFRSKLPRLHQIWEGYLLYAP